ncbi:MFS transporter [Mangrovactinospora gilvigrisea]|uniref:alpha-amylase n=1 Tax=Mangrovactinospora gilvigrisea TaxID=1428644 RepID=A0A1J7BIY9_9ACTN|nr:MFS transporter [Mangrovactinospora gilvigrisea]
MTHRQILTILSGLMMGMFLASLDQTIVSTAIRTISDDLNGLSQQAWATTAYLITSTITTPLYGKLSDLHGRKPYFLAAISIFVVGSALCTFSTSMTELAGFRAFQGIGAGGLMSLALAIIGDIVPPRERSRYQGYMLAVFATSTVLGPLVGGFLAGRHEILSIAGWRWVFLVNVPIGIIALFVVAKVLNLPHTRRDHRIDWWGALFIVIGVAPLLLVAEQGREWGWSSARSLSCYGIGVVSLIIWVFVEIKMKDEALIPMRLFRKPVFSSFSVLGALIGMGMFGGMMMIPQYLQIVRGESPTRSGLLMLPMVFGMMLMSIVAGQITSKTGHYKYLPVFGTALMIVGMMLFHYKVQWDTPIWQTMVYMAVFGIGLGGCMQTLTLAMQNAVEARDIGVASASSTFFRQMGATAGTAIFLSILFSTVSGHIQTAFQAAAKTTRFQDALHNPSVINNPANKPILEMLKNPHGGGSTGVLNDSSFIQKLDPVFSEPFKQGFSSSMHTVFLYAACIVAAAFVLALFTKGVPLRQMSGLQARTGGEGDDHSAAAPGGETPALAAGTPAAAEDRPTVALATVGAQRPAHAAHAALEPVAAAGLPQRVNGKHARRGAPMPVIAQAALAAQGRPAAVTRETAATTTGAELHGVVRTVDGSPVPGAAVTLIDASGRQLGRTTSEEDGSYALAVPGAGSYVLIGAAGGQRPQAETVVVGDRGLEHDLLLPAGTSLVGTVLGGDPVGPLAGALVVATDAQGQVVASGAAGADGTFRFAELAPGTHTLTASHDGHRPAATLVEVAAGTETRQELRLSAGARLAGVVRAQSGDRPLADARVTLMDSAGGVVAATLTDEDGRYAFADLGHGAYTLVASGYPPAAATVRTASGESAHCELHLTHEEA